MKINYNQEDLKDHNGIAAIIKNKNNDILVQKHIKYGFWTIPVGKVDLGQSIEKGLEKEILEECNLMIEKYKIIAEKEYSYIRNKKKVNLKLYLFKIIKYSGTLENKEPRKHKQQIFMDLNEIKKLPYLSDATLLYLEALGFKRRADI